jgi:hypothetical protein
MPALVASVLVLFYKIRTDFARFFHAWAAGSATLPNGNPARRASKQISILADQMVAPRSIGLRGPASSDPTQAVYKCR